MEETRGEKSDGKDTRERDTFFFRKARKRQGEAGLPDSSDLYGSDRAFHFNPAEISYRPLTPN